jgi:hypothetical protein
MGSISTAGNFIAAYQSRQIPYGFGWLSEFVNSQSVPQVVIAQMPHLCQTDGRRLVARTRFIRIGLNGELLDEALFEFGHSCGQSSRREWNGIRPKTGLNGVFLKVLIERGNLCGRNLCPPSVPLLSESTELSDCTKCSEDVQK